MAGETIRVQSVGRSGAYALRVTDSTRLWRYHHDRYCITLTSSGHGRWRYRHQDADVSPRGLMLMEPGETHANTSVHSAGTFFALFVAPEQIDPLLDCGETRRPHFRRPTLECDNARTALQRLQIMLDTEDPEAQEQHLGETLTTVLGVSAEREVVIPRVSQRKLRLGMRTLQERYRAEPWKTVDLGEVAAELSLSYHWFVHGFRREFGLAPYQFVKALRVANARSLMSRGPNDGTRTLGAIAFQVGYADPAHMHREFLRDCGVKPSVLAAALNPGWQRGALVARSLPAEPNTLRHVQRSLHR